jgi:hypothetical protein
MLLGARAIPPAVELLHAARDAVLLDPQFHNCKPYVAAAVVEHADRLVDTVEAPSGEQRDQRTTDDDNR